VAIGSERYRMRPEALSLSGAAAAMTANETANKASRFDDRTFSG
jgi:hypothetical protein